MPNPAIECDSPIVEQVDATAAAVLRLVLYFDVFKHPLTMSELKRFVAPEDPGAVEDATRMLIETGRLESIGRYRLRPGTMRTVARREQRVLWAERRWPAARRAAGVLAGLPFVRGVLVTGGMSKNSTELDGDVDYLLLVQPGQVWTLKSVLQGMRRVLPYRVRELFCTNYLLDTDHLEIDDKNLFTAVELATAVPMAGPKWCTALLDANRWATRFVPGLQWSVRRAQNAPIPTRRAWARAIETAALDRSRWLEEASMEFWDWYWNRKYGWVSEGQRAQRFKRRAEIATNHLHDFQEFVLREVRSRFREVGLDEAVELV